MPRPRHSSKKRETVERRYLRDAYRFDPRGRRVRLAGLPYPVAAETRGSPRLVRTKVGLSPYDHPNPRASKRSAVS